MWYLFVTKLNEDDMDYYRRNIGKFIDEDDEDDTDEEDMDKD